MIKKPRGTKDIYGLDDTIYRTIFQTFEQLAKTYNIKKITTPAFELLELFRDANGETSDIVTKEIYKFKDYNNRDLVLKPEGTAPVGRAILENKLYTKKEFNKLYYIDSMFRYEKPQKGRLRQFYQIGVELTNELNVNSIIDSITLANSLLKKLKIHNYVLNINSIGSVENRKEYTEELKKYFRKYKNELSTISQERIEINPLRILDDKEDSKLSIVQNAPKICDFYSAETKKEFESVLKALDELNIKYEINHSLVRGLDYYSNIVFEFISQSEALGTKATIIGGGCYLNLIKNEENNIINGVGFGVGVERLFEIIKFEQKFNELKSDIDVNFLIEKNEQYQKIYNVIYNLRENGVVVEYNYKIRKFKKLLDDALKQETKLIVFQELKQQNTDNWTIKENGKNIEVNLENLNDKINELLQGK